MGFSISGGIVSVKFLDIDFHQSAVENLRVMRKEKTRFAPTVLLFFICRMLAANSYCLPVILQIFIRQLQ